MRYWWWVVSFLVACGDDRGTFVDAGPHAPAFGPRSTFDETESVPAYGSWGDVAWNGTEWVGVWRPCDANGGCELGFALSHIGLDGVRRDAIDVGPGQSGAQTDGASVECTSAGVCAVATSRGVDTGSVTVLRIAADGSRLETNVLVPPLTGEYSTTRPLVGAIGDVIVVALHEGGQQSAVDDIAVYLIAADGTVMNPSPIRVLATTGIGFPIHFNRLFDPAMSCDVSGCSVIAGECDWNDPSLACNTRMVRIAPTGVASSATLVSGDARLGGFACTGSSCIVVERPLDKLSLRGRITSLTGTTVGSTFTIAINSTATNWPIDVAVDTSGFVVVTNGQETDTGSAGPVRARRVSVAGLVSAPITLRSDASVHSLATACAATRCIATFQDDESLAFARFESASLDDETTVMHVATTQFDPHAVSNGDDEFLVVWSEEPDVLYRYDHTTSFARYSAATGWLDPQSVSLGTYSWSPDYLAFDGQRYVLGLMRIAQDGTSLDSPSIQLWPGGRQMLARPDRYMILGLDDSLTFLDGTGAQTSSFNTSYAAGGHPVGFPLSAGFGSVGLVNGGGAYGNSAVSVQRYSFDGQVEQSTLIDGPPYSVGIDLKFEASALGSGAVVSWQTDDGRHLVTLDENLTVLTRGIIDPAWLMSTVIGQTIIAMNGDSALVHLGLAGNLLDGPTPIDVGGDRLVRDVRIVGETPTTALLTWTYWDETLGARRIAVRPVTL